MFVMNVDSDGFIFLIWVVDCGNVSVMEVFVVKGVEIDIKVCLLFFMICFYFWRIVIRVEVWIFVIF